MTTETKPAALPADMTKTAAEIVSLLVLRGWAEIKVEQGTYVEAGASRTFLQIRAERARPGKARKGSTMFFYEDDGEGTSLQVGARPSVGYPRLVRQSRENALEWCREMFAKDPEPVIAMGDWQVSE